MADEIKLFLYSLQLSDGQFETLARLVGKPSDQIKVGLIENAADIIPGSSSWLEGIRKNISDHGFTIEKVDLRLWAERKPELYDLLKNQDVIWVGGGHTYYLRWILKESGADQIIKELVREGKVYAGWSAGAVVAGPTLQFFDAMGDDPQDAPQSIQEGLGLCSITVVPHIDHPDFMEGAKITQEKLRAAGFNPIVLKDDQALFLDGKHQEMI